MALTKPAGCALMIIGLVVFVVGFSLLGATMTGDGSVAVALLVMALGIWLAWIGRKPGAEAAAIRTSDAATAARPTRPCPACAEMVLTAATKCRFCGEPLSPA